MGGKAYHTVKMVKGRTIEQKQQFVEIITKEVVDEYDRKNWDSNGQLHSLKFGESFGNKGAE
jgi:4-oxalocrotonate tautomerase